MKQMPKKIKDKLVKLRKTEETVRALSGEIEEMFEEYGVNTEYLRALKDCDSGAFQTEALTFIETCEGSIEENIADIEEVFLYYVNKH